MARKRKKEETRRLLIDPSGQTEMFEKSYEQEIREEQEREVECLGRKFPNDAARRAYFLDRLREHLEDPEFRKIEGFPIGSDDDILALSDPPYYTACPNPFLSDFIKHYGKPNDPSVPYSREPFAADVSEGKNNPIYNAHSYHTKVPHKAIMRYILHYTAPGDIVFDGFCGTGMTGVAAQLCGDHAALCSLGFRVGQDGALLDDEGLTCGHAGIRRTVLSDLSPIASFIASRYCDFQPDLFAEGVVVTQLRALEKQFGELYHTEHPRSGTRGTARFYVWSETFHCPECSHLTTLFDLAVDPDTNALSSEFNCPKCKADLKKDDLERAWHTVPHPSGKGVLKEAQTRLVQVAAQIQDRTYRYSPTERDLATASHIKNNDYAWIPPDEFPHGRQTRKVKNGTGISTVPQMYTPRALLIASCAWETVSKIPPSRHRQAAMFLLTSVLTLISRRERFRDGTGKGAQSGTLYVPSLQVEKNAFDVIGRKRESFRSLALSTERSNSALSCNSHADLKTVPNDVIDYIFTDPPFGESLQYGELNFFHEAWLRVRTRLDQDCVLNYVHEKSISFYQDMMRRSFAEAFRVLKPGRWITVEFHNSQNSVWMAIQEALWQSGFTVADVRVLDKKQGTFNVVNRAGAVKQDLVISAYKANGGLEARFRLAAGTEEGVWDFVRTHLKQLPVFVSKDGQAEIVGERQNYLLFDRMVAFHVQRGVTVPLSATEFYVGLGQRFSERDGMYFTPEQVAEYDKKRMSVREVLQLQLFVTDESSSIQWLKQQLSKKPQTFQELHPQFLKEIGGWEKHEKPLELATLLEQNYLRCDGREDVPSQVHSYLSTNFKELRNKSKDNPSLIAKAKDRWYVPDPNKAGDLEKLRERALLKEFEDYKTLRAKRLKVFRIEAMRVGFKHAYDNRDYQTIVDVAEKIPDKVLQEDEKLLMYYDVAQMRLGTGDDGNLF